jgi:RNA polymerase sigma factor (sigma-70 family)
MTTASGIVLRHLRTLANSPADAPDAQLIERFTKRREESAFAVLVKRHGPLVFGVCRRILRHQQDAEDAFQATFLVLARKAASINKRASVGSWLYQVAYHMATRARNRTTNRQKREEQAAARPPVDALGEVTGRELLAVLDDELQNLPESSRDALLLCYLQGLTRDEAARRLGCSESTLKRRLEAGRSTLRQRLTRRGLALPAALLASGVAASAVPARLTAATTHAVAGTTAVSAPVAALVRSSLRSMSTGPLKTVGAILLAITFLGAGLWGYAARAGAPPAVGEPPRAAPKEDKQPPKPDEKAPTDETKATYSGRVLDADGKPVTGAKVYLLKWAMPGKPLDKTPPNVWAETDKEGRFSFTAPPYAGELFVTAAGYGPGWDSKWNQRHAAVGVKPQPPTAIEFTVRLARDDVPVSGRLLDVQGEPVAGATVRVFGLKASSDGSLTKWIDAVKKRAPGENLVDDQFVSSFFVDELAHFFPPITTDKDGRFQIKGIGRKRIADFSIEGPTIETRVIHVVTRPGVGVSELRVPEGTVFYAGGGVKELRLKPYYPPTFTHTADPGRTVTGVVRDKETGKPIAGAVVRSEQPVRYPVQYNSTTTDKEGRYRLTGMPLSAGPHPVGSGSGVVALPPDGELYMPMRRSVPPDKDAKTATCDFDLPQGVWLEGRVKDKATGRGVIASLNYYPTEGPRPAPAAEAPYRNPYAGGNRSDADGKFRMLVARQRGILGAVADGENSGHYRVGVGANKIEVVKEGKSPVILPSPVSPPGTLFADQFDALIEVKPEKGATSVRCDLELDPGRTLTIHVRDPDGKPLAGALAFGQSPRAFSYHSWTRAPLPAEFSVYGLEPAKGRTLLLTHPEKNLAARYDIKDDEKGPIAVTLQTAGTIIGRLVDDEGKPRARADISLRFHLSKGDSPQWHVRRFQTDEEGKFRLDGLVPGLMYDGDYSPPQPYLFPMFTEMTLKSGETKDLGSVKAKKFDG